MTRGAEIAWRSVVLVEADAGAGLMMFGAGVLLDVTDFVVTNAHVVGAARTVFVTMPDGRRIGAHVAQSSPGHDLAALRLIERGGWPMPWGDDAGLRVGDAVRAVGNPGGRGKAFSKGVVIDPARLTWIGDAAGAIVMASPMIVSDAPAEPGNSGGALCDRDGRFLGLVTGGGAGQCVAIPARRVRALANTVVRGAAMRQGKLGISGADQASRSAYVVTRVADDSPAARSGLRVGDALVTYNGVDVRAAGHFLACMRGALPGERVRIGVQRGLLRWDKSIELG